MIDRMTEKTIRLLLEQKEPITTSVIANEIGVSRSSIKHNLDYVKKTLQKAGVLLNSIPGKGVWLSADDHQRKAVLQLLQENSDHSSSYNYRKKYILDVLFEYNSSYTIQLFAEELNVARNVITKDLEVLEQFIALAHELDFHILGLTFSPVKGPEGNIEFLGHLTLSDQPENCPDPAEVVRQAHETLDKGADV